MEQLSFADLEEWNPVPGYEGLYEVSDHGRVKSYHRKTPRMLRPGYNRDSGYAVVVLCKDSKQTTRHVHSLVLEAFAGARPAGMEARHLDGNPANNRWAPGSEAETRAAGGNLIYGTSGANNIDQVLHGTHNNARKEECPQRHEYTPENTITTYHPDGSVESRRCRECRRSFIQELEARTPASDEDRCQDEEGCDRRKVAKDLCRKHYTRKWRAEREGRNAA